MAGGRHGHGMLGVNRPSLAVLLLAAWTAPVSRGGDLWNSFHTRTAHTRTIQFIHSWLQQYMEISGQLQALVALPSEKKAADRNQACSQPGWMLWIRETSLTLTGIKRIPRSSIPKPSHHNDWTATALRSVKAPCLNSVGPAQCLYETSLWAYFCSPVL